MGTSQMQVRPLTPDTWDDFETVMGSNGGARGCWCMHWRLSIQEWMEGKGDGNRAAMCELAKRDTPPGVVAYLDDEPVAWCAFGDRSEYPRMRRSPLLKPVDDERVVSLTCLFVKKGRRGEGLFTELISAVCDHLAETAEARTVEAYPMEPADGRKAGADTAMTGIASAFLEAGFTEVARPRSDRPVLRYSLR
ncbi:GNAT family N-acetyltransferase [Allokutzneria sp. NRRL B-24872]|uniref:GNAT family N-acetyltransferase n=1 Tax=Allokutzneria sp. NRRL B-24872 TaxID=1137961 RepID=UPI000A3CBA68|nr:GNAT family N-acetyltransferase [Allokutzneria sp. NRRL B-24872]